MNFRWKLISSDISNCSCHVMPTRLRLANKCRQTLPSYFSVLSNRVGQFFNSSNARNLNITTCSGLKVIEKYSWVSQICNLMNLIRSKPKNRAYHQSAAWIILSGKFRATGFPFFQPHINLENNWRAWQSSSISDLL